MTDHGEPAREESPQEIADALDEDDLTALDGLRQSEEAGFRWAKSRRVAQFADLTPTDVGHTLRELEEQGLVIDWTGESTPSTWGLTDLGREVVARADV